MTILYRDYTAPVVVGPECHGSLLWWRIQLRDGTLAWVAESLEGAYLVEPVSN